MAVPELIADQSPIMEFGITQRQYICANEHLQGKPLAECGRIAYNCQNANSAAATACEVLKNPKVAAYLEAQRIRLAESVKLDETGYLNLVAEDRRFAREQKNPSAAVSATALIGKVLGFVKDSKDAEIDIPSLIDAIARSSELKPIIQRWLELKAMGEDVPDIGLIPSTLVEPT